MVDNEGAEFRSEARRATLVDAEIALRLDAGVRTRLRPQHRDMKTYSINSTEFIAMPVLCAAASLLLVSGLWVLELSFGVEANDPLARKLFWTGIGLMFAAVLTECGYGVYYFIIRKESGHVSTDDSGD